MKKFLAELLSGLEFIAMGKVDSVLSVSVLVAVLFVASSILGSECNPAEHFSRLRRTNGLEMAETFARWQIRGFEDVSDLDQLVRVGALIATGADG